MFLSRDGPASRTAMAIREKDGNNGVMRLIVIAPMVAIVRVFEVVVVVRARAGERGDFQNIVEKRKNVAILAIVPSILYPKILF